MTQVLTRNMVGDGPEKGGEKERRWRRVLPQTSKT